jgi:hypothetical protein
MRIGNVFLERRNNLKEVKMKKFVLLSLAVLSVPAFAVDRVQKFDTDGDAKVSYEELTAQCHVMKALFRLADKDKDGYLSNVEMRTAKNYLFTDCKK